MGTYQKIIGTSEGIVKVNTVRRKTLQERWNLEEIMKIQGMPFKSLLYIVCKYVKKMLIKN